jgi:hypothetical protein
VTEKNEERERESKEETCSSRRTDSIENRACSFKVIYFGILYTQDVVNILILFRQSIRFSCPQMMNSL